MATVVHVFGPRDALYPASNYAQFKSVAGTNFPVESLAFDASTSETVYFLFRAVSYGSGNLTIRIRWYADTASSGDVIFLAALACITANTDTQDIETKAFGSTNSATDSHLGTTGQRLHEVTITLSNTDSIAADDWCVLSLARDISDTMSGDALVVEVGVEYADS